MANLVSIRVRGAAKVNLRLRGVAKNLKNAKPLMRLLGETLRSEYTRNMTRGVDPQQRSLAKPQSWTRFISPDVGKAVSAATKPLIRTGGLRASMGPKEITNTRLRFGFQGKFADVAENMTDGTQGKIKVRQKLIKTTQSGPNTGLQYVRILTNSGQWFTKRVRGGYVPVKPQARKFFFLSGRQHRLIERVAAKYVRNTVN